MTEIERKLNDAMALTNINNGNPLCHNDNLCHHQIVILLEVVNDATPWYDLIRIVSENILKKRLRIETKCQFEQRERERQKKERELE